MKKLILVISVILLCSLIITGVVAGDEWTCDKCSTVNTGNFCSNCGNPAPAVSWTCPNCQTKNDGNFCSNCGTPKPNTEGNKSSTITINVKINEKNRSGEYSGDLKDGKPNGNGTFTSNDSYPTLTYTGEWKNGQISGIGYLETDEYLIHFNTTQGKYDRKGVFKGDVLNGIPHGKGYYSTYNDSNTRWDYEGDWEKGLFQGEGAQHWYDENDNVVTSQIGKFIDGEYAPVSLIVPNESRMSGLYVSTKRAKVQFDVFNINRTKTIRSYEITYYSIDSNGNQVSETKTVTIDATISPKQTVKTDYFFVDYTNATGVATAITKVTFTDNSYEITKPEYSYWSDLF